MNISNNFKSFFLIFNIFYVISATAQVGIGTTTPEADLDITSENGGVLFPSVELTSYTDVTTAINPNGGALEPGTFIYNKGASGLAPSGYYIWSGDAWINIKGIKPGDLKYGVQTVDHGGWYLLDGRAKNSLPATAQLAANQLGFAANIPNAADSYLKGINGGETLGSVVGSNTASLLAENIPSTSGTGTTSIAGGHVHPNAVSSNNTQHGHTWEEVGVAETLTYDNQFDWFQGVSSISKSTTATRTTENSGDHTHTFNTNSVSHSHNLSASFVGLSETFDTKPSSLAVNIFIYLGE